MGVIRYPSREFIIGVTIGPLIDGGWSTLLRLFRMLKLFPSVGTNVVKHYTTVGVHMSFPQGVVS